MHSRQHDVADSSYFFAIETNYDSRKMDLGSDDSDEMKLLGEDQRTKSESSDSDSRQGSLDTLVFDSRINKTSTHAGDLAETWGGGRSPPNSGRLRRTQSWSGDPNDDVSSEIRILRER